MDRFRHKHRKEKPRKTGGNKDKPPDFTSDTKVMKENLKIKEILRTVKMNGSIRVKASQGKMDRNSFTDTEYSDTNTDCLPESNNESEELSATNLDVVVTNIDTQKNETKEDLLPESTDASSTKGSEPSETIKNNLDISFTEDNTIIEASIDITTSDNTSSASNNPADHQIETTEMNSKQTSVNNTCNSGVTSLTAGPSVTRHDRKLSLDHTGLTRRDSKSQSDFDINSLGKSPLERKSSFFRKKMDSFLRNTTELFKRQSLGSKPIRRGSISASLQSLNEQQSSQQQEAHGSTHSLSVVNRSTSSLAGSFQVEGDELSPTQSDDKHLQSVQSLNEACIQETLLASRAFSMSSGLDTAKGPRRRKTSERLKDTSKRVTWIASEGLTNYFRRLIQDERGEMGGSNSYSDFSSIPEDETHDDTLDSKGRRLSYQRAVSGEDPVLPSKYQDPRRHLIPENSEASFGISSYLAEFNMYGVPSLRGFTMTEVEDEALAYLEWAERCTDLRDFYDPESWPPSEEPRQAVILELVATEAAYIRHMMSLVQVFMAAAHALQDRGKLLDIDTERLFKNIPDVLNASLEFWQCAIYPMVAEAVQNKTPFNTELMSEGFFHFRDIFVPYEKYVSEQTKALDYLRSLTDHTEFMVYLGWCHSNPSCNRLQLADLLVKPMQRLTKYSVILRRISKLTEVEPELTTLVAMESFAKNYVIDVNRTIHQKEELERMDHLASCIEGYEIEFKDEDMDKYFRMFSQVNVKAPMVGCLPGHSRTILFDAELRFKDQHTKEMEVRVIILTDMLLICKRVHKTNYPYKLIRPKHVVERMLSFVKLGSSEKDVISVVCLQLDDVGSSISCFTLYGLAKDPEPSVTLKLFDYKLRQAKLTYEYGVWYARNPSRDLSELEPDTSSDGGIAARTGKSTEEAIIEKDARELVAIMVHRPMGASTDYEFSMASMPSDSVDGGMPSSGAARMALAWRHPMYRTSTGSSRNSRLSSFHLSSAAASHEDPQPGCSRYCTYRPGSSVEHHLPTPSNTNEDSVSAITSITVNVVSEEYPNTVVPTEQRMSPSPSKLSTRCPSSLGHSHNTLRVQPSSGVMALVHSLPDLSIRNAAASRLQHTPAPTASDKLYQSHNELLQRNRMAAAQRQQYLSPDHRGTSYPPPSPTRAALKRGLAFSYSFKNPPLSKMGHVHSQSQMHPEAGPSTSQGNLVPSTSGFSEKPDKPEKKSKSFSSRNKGSGSSSSTLTGKEKRNKRDG